MCFSLKIACWQIYWFAIYFFSFYLLKELSVKWKIVCIITIYFYLLCPVIYFFTFFIPTYYIYHINLFKMCFAGLHSVYTVMDFIKMDSTVCIMYSTIPVFKPSSLPSFLPFNPPPFPHVPSDFLLGKLFFLFLYVMS